MSENNSTRFHIRLIFILAFTFLFIQVKSQDGLLPDTIRSCYVDSLMLNAGPGFDTYQWSNGDTTQTSWISSNGTYSVIAAGDTTLYDTTRVYIFNAFLLRTDTTISCGDTVTISGNSDEYNYLWTPGDYTDSSIVVSPLDTMIYYVTISDTATPSEYCIDSARISVNPLITIDTILQLGMGCKGEEKAEIKMEVTGGHPGYNFEWPLEAYEAEDDPSHAYGLSDGMKTITITDSIGCKLVQDFEVKAFPLPELDLFTDPGDTVYLQKPYITFRFENPMYDSLGTDTFDLNWSQWNFGDSDSSTLLTPTHVYSSSGPYDVLLKFRTFYDCPGEDSIKVLVKPVKLLVPAVITPNGDGANDVFVIWNDEEGNSGNSGGTTAFKAGENEEVDLSEFYLSNTLVIFNRWGEKVFEVDNYENDWRAENLADGVYFYVLKCHGEHSDDVYKGSFSIMTKVP